MENIETINKYLSENFGIDTITGQPIYRVVWAEDQFENQLTQYTDSGIMLLHPEIRMLPKYSWLKGVWVLEKLTLTPEVNLKELAGTKIAYNVLHAFIGANDQPVPPMIWACKFIIDLVNAATGKGNMAHYLEDPDAASPVRSKSENYEIHKKEIDQLQNEIFGDESGLQGRTVKSGGDAIIMPQNYKKGR